MIYADWFGALAVKAGLPLEQHGRSGDAFTLGSPKDFSVRAEFTDTPPYLRFLPSDSSREKQVERLAAQAAARVEAGDFGGIVWFSTELHERTFSLAMPSFMGSFMERLGNQQRIIGRRRLGRDILLEFSEEAKEGDNADQVFFAPKAIVKVQLALPSPRPGHFASHVAHHAVETIGGICTLALGRPVALPPTVFPTRTEDIETLDRNRTDRSVLTLARKGVPLDVFGWAGVPGGLQVFAKLRAALLSFDAAVKQEHDAVASILYVVAGEALATPSTRWRKDKATRRFRDFFEELVPDLMDEIVGHGNFEAAFGIRRGNRTAKSLRRRALEKLYSFRSGELHEGLRPVYRGFVGDTDFSIRRALFSDFAEGAILRFIQAPRSSLAGHPGMEAQRAADGGLGASTAG